MSTNGSSQGQGVLASIRTDERVQNLWSSLQRRAWRSLAVVALTEDVDTLEVAELLAKVASWHEGRSPHVLDLRDLSQRLLDYYKRELQVQLSTGSRVVVALRPVSANPTTLAMTEVADAVIVCVGLGKAARKAVEATLEAVGRERVVGALVFDEDVSKT
ncbi:MAG: hypothetical protein ACRENE_33005 [Polyangiaceae bacterium]